MPARACFWICAGGGVLAATGTCAFAHATAARVTVIHRQYLRTVWGSVAGSIGGGSCLSKIGSGPAEPGDASECSKTLMPATLVPRFADVNARESKTSET